MKKASKSFHPALKRSGMRLNGNQKAKGSIYVASSSSNGTIKFCSSYGKTSKKNQKRDKSVVHQRLEKISSVGEADENEREESKHK